MNRAVSSGMVLAVSPTIGTSASISRILLVASRPSMTGIRRSMITRSNSPLAHLSTASAPSLAVTQTASMRRSSAARTMRTNRSSSTRSTRRGRSTCIADGATLATPSPPKGCVGGAVTRPSYMVFRASRVSLASSVRASSASSEVDGDVLDGLGVRTPSQLCRRMLILGARSDPSRHRASRLAMSERRSATSASSPPGAE
mmetsp:Transcript_13418/g.52540  ORF Transcript_13418/g.52540 Transcript_13418/m.52540 type:complete len:201 (+) Transcript_13418:465-1067(+)